MQLHTDSTRARCAVAVWCFHVMSGLGCSVTVLPSTSGKGICNGHCGSRVLTTERQIHFAARQLLCVRNDTVLVRGIDVKQDGE
ncbi:hypothetical protein BC628DRAFT_1345810 [Trametes gibbosa]|nr:hypothetical protein BC628DRAFT_1345810 [Trametes gibbosa]